MKYYFVVNPTAGKVNHLSIINEKVTEYTRLNTGVDCEVIATEYAGHAVHIAKRIAQTNEEAAVIACGGDGTLNECAQGVYGFKNIMLGCYPCGTGNDFIKCFDVERRHFRDISKLINGKNIKIDLISCNDRIAVNNVNVGFDAEVAKRVVKYKKITTGSKAYIMALIQSFFSKTKFLFEIHTSTGFSAKRKFIFCNAGNGKVYGGGFVAAPKADCTDGELDFTCVTAVTRLKMLLMINKYKKGEHEKIKQITSRRETDIRIKSDVPLCAALDGEITESREYNIKIIKKAIDFILPKENKDV